MPATIVYDRTKTVVRRHVGRGQATPLHPEAVAFAANYGFAIWLAAPYRAETKGRVERQRMVYAALGDLMSGAIHALAMQTLTPEEWRRSQP